MAIIFASFFFFLFLEYFAIPLLTLNVCSKSNLKNCVLKNYVRRLKTHLSTTSDVSTSEDIHV